MLIPVSERQQVRMRVRAFKTTGRAPTAQLPFTPANVDAPHQIHMGVANRLG